MIQQSKAHGREDSVLRFLRVVQEHGLVLRDKTTEVQSPAASRPLTQVDAAELAGLSRPSVAQYAQRMRGTLLEEDQLVVRASSGYAIGVDISATHGPRVALSDISGQIIETYCSEEGEDRLRPQGGSEALGGIEDAIGRLLEEHGLDSTQVVGVGISLPGPVKGGNRIGRDAGIWRHLSAADELARRLGWEGVPFVTQSDSYASALAENMWGGEQIAANTLYVKWAARLRSAIVIDGNLYVGHSGTAGELPHQEVERLKEVNLVLRNRGKLEDMCPVCHETKCLHMIAPLAPISRAFTGEDDKMASALIREAMGDGDESEEKLLLLQVAAAAVGTAIAPLVEALDPESVVIGGAMGSRAFPWVCDDLTEALTRAAPREKTVIVRGGRLQELTSVRGAVALALREFAPQYLRSKVV